MYKLSGIIAAAAALVMLVAGCGESGKVKPEAAAAPILKSCSYAEGVTLPWNTTSIDVKFEYDQNVKVPVDKKSGVTINGGASVAAVSALNTIVTVKIDGIEPETSYTLNIAAGTIQGFKENQNGASVATLSFSTEQKPAEKPDPGDIVDLPDNEAVALAKKLSVGWNLGNQMDAYVNWECDEIDYPKETVWGNDLATQATFDGVKNAGFKSVRIPITWLRMIGPAPEYKIDETWLNRVAELVGYAEKAGLNCIINTHHDENHGNNHWLDVANAAKSATKHAEITNEVKVFWTQVAEKFKDKGDWLIFESFNEINDGGWGWSSAFRADPAKQCNVLNDWNQAFVDAVRATGGNNATRWLGVPTYCASPSYTEYFKLPNDPANKVMLSVHFYDPSDYTIGEKQYPEWGHTGASGSKVPGQDGDESHVREVFGKLRNDYVMNNIPVYVGECGCSLRSKSNTRAWKFYLYYLEYVSKAARSYGLPCFLWDNGTKDFGAEQHGYLDHGTGAYINNAKEPVDAFIKGWTNNSSSYTLESVYNNAPK